MFEVLDNLHLLFDDLKESDDKAGFIFGAPGSGSGFVFKMELIDAFMNTEDEIFVIDKGETKHIVEQLCGISLDSDNIKNNINLANKYRVVEFRLPNKNEQIYKEVLKYIKTRCTEISRTWILIRDSYVLTQYKGAFDLLLEIAKNYNVKFIFEGMESDCIFKDNSFTNVIKNSRHMILLNQPCMSKQMLKETLNIPDDTLRLIADSDTYLGAIINNNVNSPVGKVDSSTDLYRFIINTARN